MKNAVAKTVCLLVGLDTRLVKETAICVAETLGNYYLDVDDMIEYSIMDKIGMRLKCGMEYFNKQERGVVESLNDFENTIFSTSYELFIKHISFFEKFNVIYLKANRKLLEKQVEEDTANATNIENALIVFDERNAILTKYSDKIIGAFQKKETYIKKLVIIMKEET